MKQKNGMPLAQAAAEDIIEMIRTNHMKPGDRLENEYELAKKVMEHIVSLVSGYFCADNENLQPRIPAKEAEQTTVES